MNNVSLLIAPLGARHQREQIFHRLAARCPDHDYSRVLYIGPNVSFLSSITKLFCSHLARTGTTSYIPFRTSTIEQLGASLHELHGQNELIPDEIRTLILLSLINEHNLGYARLLSGLLSKIKHYLPDSSLADIIDKLGQLIVEEKARDRACNAMRTMDAYEHLLHEKKLSDTEGMLKNAITLINEHLSPFITVIDGFFDPTPLEIRIIGALLKKSGNVLILAEQNTPLADERVIGAKPAVSKLEADLKRTPGGYYAYPSIEDEVDGIAKSVKKLLLDNIVPWDITVSFPVLEQYLPMVKRIFKRHGIPLNAGGQGNASAGPLITLRELLSCIEDDYPRTDFLSVLTSPLFPAIPLVIKELAVGLAYRAGIIKGRESWLSIGATIITESGYITDAEKKQISDFQLGVSKVIETLEQTRHARHAAAFIDAFEHALSSLGFFDALEESGRSSASDIGPGIRGQLSLLRRFADVYHPASRSATDTVSCIRFVLENLALSHAVPDGVRVVSFDQASSIETAELFCGGMIEGDFPSRPAIDPILPEQVKKELGMPHLEYYLARQQKYFYRLLHISKGEPHFSCPTAEGEKIFLASPFLDWDRMLQPVAWDIFSEEEVLVRDGLIKGGGLEPMPLWKNTMSLNRTSLRLINKAASGYLNVTDLDFYRKCPMRFYIEKVLQITIDKPPRFEVEARLWGSLAHKVMEQLFREGDFEITAIETRLFGCLDSILKDFPIDDFWGRVAERIFQKLVPKLTEQESDIRMQGYRPHMVEKKLTAEVDGLKLKGKIDRVDVKIQGSKGQGVRGASETNEYAKTVILLDYKTGALDTDSLQMPLYALLWQENCPEPVDKLGFYSLKEGRVSWYPKKGSITAYIDKALSTAQGLVHNMKKGYFRPEPFKSTECRYCSHRAICRGAAG